MGTEFGSDGLDAGALQIVLALVVRVEGRSAHAGLAADVVHRDGLVALVEHEGDECPAKGVAGPGYAAIHASHWTPELFVDIEGPLSGIDGFSRAPSLTRSWTVCPVMANVNRWVADERHRPEGASPGFRQ